MRVYLDVNLGTLALQCYFLPPFWTQCVEKWLLAVSIHASRFAYSCGQVGSPRLGGPTCRVSRWVMCGGPGSEKTLSSAGPLKLKLKPRCKLHLQGCHHHTGDSRYDGHSQMRIPHWLWFRFSRRVLLRTYLVVATDPCEARPAGPKL